MPLHPAERLSVEPDVDDEFAFWPVNLLLILMGSTILVVAFYYLDPSEERLLRNPWTYVVVTPFVLGMISVVLSTIVSKIVEKSMQLAFLVSVLVHLFLLIGAMNVVIFSRLWPDILESLAQERHQMKREMLQARQYHRTTSTNATGSRPDYLQYQPTQHQPTEVEYAKSPSLALARSTVNNLVSPVPEIERQVNPHVIERQQPSPALPNPSDSAASLSRSESRQSIENRNVPQQFRLQQTSEAPELQASSRTARRRQSSRDSASQQQPAMQLENPLRQPPRETPSLSRAESPATRQNPSNTRQTQSRAQLLADNSPATERTIRSPISDVSRSESPRELAAATTESGRRRNPRSEQSTMQAPSSQSINSPTVASMQPSASPLRRRESQQQTPRPTFGDTASIPRSSAGGASGPPAASSMPVQGVESFASESSASSQQLSAQMTDRLRSNQGRAAASLPSTGMPSAPQWNQSPSLAGGATGRSPLDVASSQSGSAAQQDSANLRGAGRDLQRAATGLPGTVGAISVPSATGQGQSESGSNSPNSTQLADGGGLSRRRSRASDNSSIGGGLPTFNADGEGQPGTTGRSVTPAEMARATGQSSAGSPASSGSPLGQEKGQALARSDVNGSGPAAPAGGPIEVPDNASTNGGNQGDSDSAEMLADSGTGRSRRSASADAATNLLALDAPNGVGGISPRMDLAGDLLPRRSTAPRRENSPVDLEVQRFSRQEVGGRIAAGQIAIPRPAFQQRLERLRDRDPLEQTMVEPETELAIERGLGWLARHQRPDGSWRLQDFDTEVLMTSDTAATGLALLAFQGAGYTHKEFKYADTVNRGIQYLRQQQVQQGEFKGDLYVKQDPASDQNAWLYSHAIAALALSEAYGMTQDPELESAAQSAIDFMVAAQDKQRGGWRYRPGLGSDTSVSGWFMMAFKSAQLAGLEVPERTFGLLDMYLTRSQVEETPHLFRYNPYAKDTPQQRHGLKPTAVMTSVGLLMRLYTGWGRDSLGMTRGTDYLLEHLPEHGTQRNSKRDTYYWYYATQVMFHMGGEKWEAWHEALYPLLIESQVNEGENEGSWEPNSPTPDLWVRYGGRLYVTTMNLLSLEVSYRHLPLYDATGAPGYRELGGQPSR